MSQSQQKWIKTMFYLFLGGELYEVFGILKTLIKLTLNKLVSPYFNWRFQNLFALMNFLKNVCNAF